MVSALVLTMDSIACIKDCLASLSSQEAQLGEVIVVDNGSRDGTPEWVEQNYPSVKLLRNPRNMGAAFARNQGIRAARGAWVLVLDCDVALGKGFVVEWLRMAGDIPAQVGAVQPVVLNMPGSSVFSAGVRLTWLRRFYDIGRGKKFCGRMKRDSEIFGPTSAAALYRRAALEQVQEASGYFDERFFFLVEDVDLAWRLRDAGLRTLYRPKLHCYHSGNSSQNTAPMRQYLCWRNRKLMLRKHPVNMAYSLALRLLYDAPRAAYLLACNRYFRRKAMGRPRIGVIAEELFPT